MAAAREATETEGRTACQGPPAGSWLCRPGLLTPRAAAPWGGGRRRQPPSSRPALHSPRTHASGPAQSLLLQPPARFVKSRVPGLRPFLPRGSRAASSPALGSDTHRPRVADPCVPCEFKEWPPAAARHPVKSRPNPGSPPHTVGGSGALRPLLEFLSLSTQAHAMLGGAGGSVSHTSKSDTHWCR